jgi:phosphoribosylpyrophosphate synthetase
MQNSRRFLAFKSFALQVVVTNTVPHDVQKMQCHKIKTVDISAMISEGVRRIHNQESMSHLFQHISTED